MPSVGVVGTGSCGIPSAPGGLFSGVAFGSSVGVGVSSPVTSPGVLAGIIMFGCSPSVVIGSSTVVGAPGPAGVSADVVGLGFELSPSPHAKIVIKGTVQHDTTSDRLPNIVIYPPS